jgi:aminopeptidase N
MVHFHSKKGDGYAFIGDCIIELDALNPQVAARLAGMVYCMCYHLLKCFISKSRNFIQEYLLDPNPSPSLAHESYLTPHPDKRDTLGIKHIMILTRSLPT